MQAEILKFSARVRGHHIECEKEDDLSGWYIRVSSPSGSYSYDGYWRDSVYKTPGQALDEAIHGACIKQAEEDDE